MPTPDASWTPTALAAFDHWETGLDLLRLAIFSGVTGLALLIFVVAILSPSTLRR